MPRQGCHTQRGILAGQRPNFEERRKGQTDPTGKPQAEIARLVIAAQEKQQNEQNDESCSFEEGDAEKALVLQHDVLPPGTKCRRPAWSCPRIFSGQREALMDIST